jgi:ABC-2 type transport system ATP-binding protein
VTGAAVTVEGASKHFRMYRERNQSLKATLMRGRRASYDEFWALKDVSFEVPQGSTFGLIGENGSGKSTMLKCIAKILRPDSGSVRTTGSLAALLELGSGFHPELSGRENVFLNGSILGMSKAEITRKFDHIVDFSGIEEFIDQPVKNYSSGMYVRLGFSIAINVDPDILLVDEVLAVGDVKFQEKCMEKFADFRQSGRTVILVSHAMGSLRSMCDQAAWLEHGRLLGAGRATHVVDDYVASTHSDRVAQADGSVRSGSGEVQFTKLEMLGPDRIPTSSVRTSDPVTFRLTYRANERIIHPVLVLDIEDLSGVFVWAHNTRDGDFDVTTEDGETSVDLVIPSLHLQPGTFVVRSQIVDYEMTHTYDKIENWYRFDVLPTEPHESGGIVALDSRWCATASVDLRP